MQSSLPKEFVVYNKIMIQVNWWSINSTRALDESGYGIAKKLLKTNSNSFFCP